MKDEAGGVILVEASAGSGKTRELAKRYLSLIFQTADSVSIREILAITFTNKAAIEMKGRILSLLKQIALGGPDANSIIEELFPGPVSREEASSRARLAIEAILGDYGNFRVQTTDSFIKSVLESSLPNLGLPSGFRIKTAYEEYIDYCLDQLVARAGSEGAVKRLFENFIAEYLLGGAKSGWFPRNSLAATINELFKHSNIYGMRFAKTPSGKLMSKRKKLFSRIKILSGSFPEGTSRSLVNIFSRVADYETMDIASLAESKIITGSHALPMRKGFQPDDKTSRAWDEFREALREYCEAECFSGFNNHVDIFAKVSAFLEALAREEGIIFLEELNKRAAGIMQDENFNPGELFLRLATRFRHYLLDEFQDTSGLQRRNFSPLFVEGLSAGGSLFCVGDRKQAIFRFRGTDYRLIDSFREQYGGFGVKERKLSRNFRSSEAVVSFNNSIFSGPNLDSFLSQAAGDTLSRGDIDNIIEIYSASRQTCVNKNGFVRVEQPSGKGGEEHAAAVKDRIFSLLSELNGRFQFSEIAVLTRTNEQVGRVCGWLAEKSIPALSERTLNMMQDSSVRELLSLLAFLDSPIDNAALAGFILGDVFSGGTGTRTSEIRKFMFDRNRAKSPHYLYNDFRRTFPDIWAQYLEKLFKTAGLTPLYEFMLDIIDSFRVLDNFPLRQGFTMKLLEVINDYEKEEGEGEVSIPSFLRYLEALPEEDLCVPSAGGEAVNVMTIHKSKGLEFPAVIIPFFSISPKPNLGSDSLLPEMGGGEARLLRLKKPYINVSEKLHGIFAEEFKKAMVDELNLAYVSFTRAREELYVFAPANRKNRSGSLIPPEFESGMKRLTPPEAEAGDDIEFISAVRRKPGSVMLEDALPGAEELMRRKQQAEGEFLHRVLSKLGNLSPLNPENEIKRAIRESATEKEPHFDSGNISARIAALLSHPECRKFFFLEEGIVQTEKEIADSAGRLSRIDRLVLKDREAWVVDFKVSGPRPEDILQVERYMDCVKRIYPGKKVLGHIVFTQTPGVEKING